MGCANCSGSANASIPYLEGALDFSKVEVSKDIVASKSMTKPFLPIESTLVKAMPPFGWCAYIKVGNSKMKITAINPMAKPDTAGADVANQVIAKYREAGIDISPLSVWYCLNMFWLWTIDKSLRSVDISLLEQISPNYNKATLDGYPPQKWGARGWGILQVLLASKSAYSHDAFVSICEVLCLLLKDELIGCEDCYVSFLAKLEEFKKEPRDKDYAKKWVFEIMNECKAQQNHSTLSWEMAEKVCMWNLE